MTDRAELAVSRRYLGAAGAKYYEYHQAEPLHFGHRVNLDYFRPYLKPPDSVLDFGCGNGGLLRLITKEVRHAEGLEVNPTAAASARSSGLRVYASTRELPSTGVYDVVVSNHVLEHVRDVASTLERLRLSLKEGGLLLLKLPLDDWRARDQRTWSRDDPNHHLQTWTPRLIANVLYEAGYEVEDVRVVTSAWHPRLFPLARLGLARLAFRVFAVVKRRRQLFAVARVTSGDSAGTSNGVRSA